MRLTLFGLVIAVLFSAAPGSAQTITADTAACWTAASDSSFAGWQPVRGHGFVYCIPPKWKAVGKGDKTTDALSWSLGSAEIRWASGAPQLPPTSAFSPYSLTDTKDFYEQVAGRGMHARQMTFRHGVYFTQVTWAETPIYFQGISQDSRVAKQELQIYRTVKFEEP